MAELSRQSSAQHLTDEEEGTSLTSFPDSAVLPIEHESSKKPLQDLLEGDGPSMFDQNKAIGDNDPQALSAASSEVLQTIIDHRGAVELVRRLSSLLAQRDAHITALIRLAEEYKVPQERIDDAASRVKQAERRRMSLATASEDQVLPRKIRTESIASQDSNKLELVQSNDTAGSVKGLTRLFGGGAANKSKHLSTPSVDTLSVGPRKERPRSLDVRSIKSIQSVDSSNWKDAANHIFRNPQKGPEAHRSREPVEMTTRHDRDQLPPTLSVPSRDTQQATNPKQAAWNRFILHLMQSRQQSGEDTGSIGLIGASRFGHEGQEGRQRMQTLIRLVLEGVPIQLRHSVWMELSNVDAIVQPQAFSYFLGLGDENDPGEREAILKDVPRTLTSKYDFYADKGFKRLQEVLVAFVGKYRELGYTQGLNTIAGYLLLAIPVEEDAFWMLCNLVENFFPEDYFSRSYAMEGPQADNTLLRNYVKQLMPQLSNHLDKLQIPATHTVPMKWFFTAFSNVVSETMLMRIWDVWLCLPNQRHFLFNVALMLLFINSENIMACDSDSALYAYIDNELKVPQEPDKITKFIKEAINLGKKLEDIEEKRSQGLKWRLKRVGSVEVLMNEPIEDGNARSRARSVLQGETLESGG